MRYFSIFLFLLIFSLNNAYADKSLRGTGAWRRLVVWENPITGKNIPLFDHYGFSTRVPGLRWTLKRVTYKGSSQWNSINYFDFFILRLPDIQAGELEEYTLKSDDGEKTICGFQILQGTAVDRKGKSYAFSQLQSVFGKEKKNYSVIFISKIAEKEEPWDKNALCRVVQSFYIKEDNIQIFAENGHMWKNPLSGKYLKLDANVKVEVEDIVSHRLGSYQAYSVTHGDLHAELIKVRGRPYVSDVFEMDNIKTLHLTDGTVFHWEDRGYKTGIHTKYKGHFTQAIADGKERSGIVFSALAQGEFVVVKVWQVNGKVLTADERNWAEELLKNSIPD